jgi:hypothetical protein
MMSKQIFGTATNPVKKKHNFVWKNKNMKRSKEEVFKSLLLVKKILEDSQTVNENGIRTGTAPGLLLETFNKVAQEEADLSQVSMRTLENYLKRLKYTKEAGDPLNIVFDRKTQSYVLGGAEANSTAGLEPQKRDFEKQFLKTYANVLPSITVRRFNQEDEIDPPTIRFLSPRMPIDEIYADKILKLMSAIDSYSICSVEYGLVAETSEPREGETSEGSMSLRSTILPLQINEYMGRFYLLAYKINIHEYTGNKSFSWEPEHLIMYTLHHIRTATEYQCIKLDDFKFNHKKIDTMESGFKELGRAGIFKALRLTDVQKHMIGVMLPGRDVFRDGSPPTRCQYYFAGWAYRYIMSSRLHESQNLLEFYFCPKEELPPHLKNDKFCANGVEIGLFEFHVYPTVDLEFRLGAFRHYVWPKDE